MSLGDIFLGMAIGILSRCGARAAWSFVYLKPGKFVTNYILGC
jgi:hypothetical protein